jgi:hypothetical protein
MADTQCHTFTSACACLHPQQPGREMWGYLSYSTASPATSVADSSRELCPWPGSHSLGGSGTDTFPRSLMLPASPTSRLDPMCEQLSSRLVLGAYPPSNKLIQGKGERRDRGSAMGQDQTLPTRATSLLQQMCQMTY